MIPLTWWCTVSLLENLGVNAAFGQVQGLVAGPSASALQTLISLQEPKMESFAQLGSLWQQLFFILHDKELLSCQLCLGLSSFNQRLEFLST